MALAGHVPDCAYTCEHKHYILCAGALGGYMWKNRAINQSSEQLLSIAGIAAISLAMGWSNETTVDNLGGSSCPF